MIYKYLNYRVIIKKIVENKKRIGEDITFEMISKRIRIQKSYLSKTLKGDASLSSDQMYELCEFLELDEEEREFLFLLLEYDRSALSHRRKKLREQIERIQKEKLETGSQIKAKEVLIDSDSSSYQEYYLRPINQLVHMALTIPKFKRDLELLASSLHLPFEDLMTYIKSLEKMGVISTREGVVEVLVDDLHLSRESHLFWAWKSQLDLLASSKIRALNKDQTYNFSVLFSADEQARKKIHENFMEFLKSCEGIVKNSKEAKLYQMNFDLFNWL